LLLAGWLGCADDRTATPQPSGTVVDEVTVEMNGVTATAYLRGDNILLELESDEPMYQDVCSRTSTLEKRVGDTWQPLRVDLPQGFHDGYYFNDVYATPTFGLGCDVTTCLEMDGTANAGPAVEIVAAGTREPPAWVDSPHTANPAPVYVTEPVSGPLRVQLSYSRNAACSSSEVLSIEIEVPEDGVCCPVGPAGCSSAGPGGGWAPSLEACVEWNGTTDEYSELITDTRGCPALRRLWARTGDDTVPDCTQPMP